MAILFMWERFFLRGGFLLLLLPGGAPSDVDVDDDPAPDLAVEDLPSQPRQLVEAGHGADRVDALRRQHLGQPLPGGEAPLPPDR